LFSTAAVIEDHFWGSGGSECCQKLHDYPQPVRKTAAKDYRTEEPTLQTKEKRLIARPHT